jgi:dihydrofolate reductase
MRKLIMWNVITLDGYFEGKQNWDLDFHNVIWGPELEQISIDQLKATDYLVFGRVTYEGMAAYWKEATGEVAELMNALPKLVFSRTLESVDWNNSILVKEDASAAIARIKSEGDGEMYVFGSANLSETFMQDGLFDEYRIGIASVILGGGRPLFGESVKGKALELVRTQQLSAGGAILTYLPKTGNL